MFIFSTIRCDLILFQFKIFRSCTIFTSQELREISDRKKRSVDIEDEMEETSVQNLTKRLKSGPGKSKKTFKRRKGKGKAK